MSSRRGISLWARCAMNSELRRGMVIWAELDPVRGREQSGRRPALVIASDLYLDQADTLAIIVPCTTRDRGWLNHVTLTGKDLNLPGETYAMTEQPRTVTRERLFDIAGMVDVGVMREVDEWLRDFFALP
jgi:mRNA interferase MazF